MISIGCQYLTSRGISILNSVSFQCARGKSFFVLFLREIRKSIPKIVNGRKLFTKCSPPDFKFYLGKLNNKKNPHLVQC